MISLGDNVNDVLEENQSCLGLSGWPLLRKEVGIIQYSSRCRITAYLGRIELDGAPSSWILSSKLLNSLY